MKPSTPLYLGIDFGTTNSSVAYIYGDPRHLKAQYVPVETARFTMDEENNLSAERMPTLISTRFDDRQATGLAKGWEVLQIFGRRKKAPLLRNGHELFESVKSDLGSSRFYAHASSPECNTPKKVAAAVFRTLLKAAVDTLPGLEISEVRTVITVPASLNADARRETREAAVEAGLNGDRMELIDEPIAALLHLLNDQRATAVLSAGEPRKILVFDYGGGTLDLCLVKCSFSPDSKTGLTAENLAISQYRRNGGNDVDREIMRQVIWPQVEGQLGVKRGDLDADLRQAVEDTLTFTLARKLKEKLCVKISKLMQEGEGDASPGPDISETVTTDGDFFDDRLGKPIRGRFKMTVAQFDEVMEPFLRVPKGAAEAREPAFSHSLVAPIWDCLERANVAPEDLDVLVLHGGSCRNPCVRRDLMRMLGAGTSLFPRAIIVDTPNLDTSVACGAALACYWKHERGIELIKPVTAEDIGILTLGNRPVCLVKSGTPLPFPSEGVYADPSDFHVPHDGQRDLIIPFYAGATDSGHRLSGMVKVPLPEGTRRGDLVKIKLTVDHNKILHWWYSIGHGEFTAADPLNDPWTPRPIEPAEKRLLAFRREMMGELSAKKQMPDWMLLREASLIWKAGQLEEAEVALRDFVAERGLTGDAANLLSLVCGEQGNASEELYYAEKAAGLNPKAPVMVGNYGCILAKAGRTEEAISTIRQALEMDADLDYLHEQLGDIHRQQGREEDALREFRQAIRVLEKNIQQSAPSRWTSLARLYGKVGDYQQAAGAQARLMDAHLNEVFEGDHRHRVAGPDSGF